MRARVTVLTPVKSAVHLSGTEISISVPSRSLIHLAAWRNQRKVLQNRGASCPRSPRLSCNTGFAEVVEEKDLNGARGVWENKAPKLLTGSVSAVMFLCTADPKEPGELSTTRPATVASVTRALPAAPFSSNSRHDTAGASCLKAILSYWSWKK